MGEDNSRYHATSIGRAYIIIIICCNALACGLYCDEESTDGGGDGGRGNVSVDCGRSGVGDGSSTGIDGDGGRGVAGASTGGVGDGGGGGVARSISDLLVYYRSGYREVNTE